MKIRIFALKLGVEGRIVILVQKYQKSQSKGEFETQQITWNISSPRVNIYSAELNYFKFSRTIFRKRVVRLKKNSILFRGSLDEDFVRIRKYCSITFNNDFSRSNFKKQLQRAYASSDLDKYGSIGKVLEIYKKSKLVQTGAIFNYVHQFYK